MSLTASRSHVGACALITLAWLGCGSDTGSPGTQGASTAGASSSTTAGASAPAAPVSAKPNTGVTTPTTPAGGSTTAAPGNTSSTPVTAPTAGTGGSSQPATPPPTTATPGTPAAGGTGSTPPPTTSTGIELPVEMGTPTLFWLDITGNAIYTSGADGSPAQKRFAYGNPLSAPDGVAVDPVGGFVYVLNMGSVLGGSNTGSLVRYKLDGTTPETLMPPRTMVDGQTFNTGKQLSMDKVNRKLYLGDREGSKVWRCDMDGKNLEVLVSGHDLQQVVGVAPDPLTKQFYFSDRNGKKLFRAGMEMPAGKTHADRDDVELLYLDKASNAMPLDIELDVKDRKMYWTDRQQNKVFTMSMDIPAGSDGMTRTDVKAVAEGLTDVIGLGFDHEAKVLYATHSGTVSSFKADGSDTPKRIGSNGVTGLAFTKIP